MKDAFEMAKAIAKQELGPGFSEAVRAHEAAHSEEQPAPPLLESVLRKVLHRQILEQAQREFFERHGMTLDQLLEQTVAQMKRGGVTIAPELREKLERAQAIAMPRGREVREGWHRCEPRGYELICTPGKCDCGFDPATVCGAPDCNGLYCPWHCA